MNEHDYINEIQKIENMANVESIKLCIIIKSILAVFSKTKFKGEIPKIKVNFYSENGVAKEWPSSYCDEEKVIHINMGAPKPLFSCASMALSFATSWAAAMHVFYAKNSYKNPKRRQDAAYKIAHTISRTIC